MKRTVIYRVSCPYNHNKIFLIKKYQCGHYYLNQEVCGYVFNRRYVRTSKRWIEEIFKYSDHRSARVQLEEYICHKRYRDAVEQSKEEDCSEELQKLSEQLMEIHKKADNSIRLFCVQNILNRAVLFGYSYKLFCLM